MQIVSNGYNIYGDEDTVNNMHFEVIFKFAIDRNVMEEAINSALAIHPNIAVMLKYVNNNFYFDKNESRFRISDISIINSNIISDINIIVDNKNMYSLASNGFLFRACIEENRLIFRFVHALADGSSFFPFVKSCILFYEKAMGNNELDELLEFRRRKYGKLDSYREPYSVANGLKRSTLKNDKKYFHISDKKYSDNDFNLISIDLDCKKLKDISKSMSSSSIIYIAGIMSEAIKKKCEPDSTISYSVIVDTRNIMGIRMASHECYSFVSFEAPYEIEFENILCENNTKLSKIRENDEIINNICVDYDIAKIFQDGSKSYEIKKRLYKHMENARYKSIDTFAISSITFSGSQEIVSDYIDRVIAYTTAKTQNMIIEMQQVGKKECITISYVRQFGEVINEFVNQLENMGLLLYKKEISI